MIQDENFSAEDAQAMAALWVLRLESADASEADWAEFDAWLQASPDHALAYDRALALSFEIETQAPALRQLSPAPSILARPERRRRFAFGAVAAFAAAAAAAVAVMLPHPEAAKAFTTYATGVGERRTVTLEDGTRIDLNGASKVSVRFEKGERRVVMDDAEAVFDVAKDASRPFLITAGDRTVRVVGTEFDVRHRSGQVAVTVRRGVVEVAPTARRLTPEARLTPGQRLEHVQGAAGSRVVSARPDEVFSWRSGRLIYRDRPLSEVVADLNANFAHPIRIADTRAAQARFSGVLVLDNEDAVVRRLSAFAPLSSKVVGDGIELRWESPTRR